VHRRVVGPQRRRALEHRRRLRVRAHGRQRAPARDVEVRVVGERRQPALVRGRRARAVADRLARLGERDPRRRRPVLLRRVRRQGVARLRPAPELGARQAEIAQHVRVVRRLLARGREEPRRLLELPRLQRDVRRPAQERRHVGLQRERRRVRLGRGRVLAALGVVLRERHVRLHELGLEVDRGAQARLGLGPLALLGEQGAERGVPRRVAGLVLHRPPERGERLVESTELLVRLAELRALPRIPTVQKQPVRQDVDELLELRVRHGALR
jgi:hypothetical protein